ncbi:hypothetical protein [Pseudomonas protegens]|uniref:hypothetical protein n=1 Tax=Pseudomonas protegens TaxID=380021 RepID=UPI00200D197E|nr:hypothetical protein [Pseudomonas protegens]
MLDAHVFYICLFMPPVASAVMILAAFIPSTRLTNDSLFSQAFGLHPEKGLMNHGLLWFSILTPVLYFITIGYVSWAPYTLDMSSKGFAKFISISTLPLAILSLAIPLPVLVSRFHATQQTATQIKVTKLKNNIDIFYAHRKAMFEYFDRIPKVKFEDAIECEFKVQPRLHINAFRGSKPEQGSPAIFEEFFKSIESNLFSARTMAHHTLTEEDVHKRLAFYRNSCIALWDASRKLLIGEMFTAISDNSIVIKEARRTNPRDAYVITIGQTTSELIGSYRMCRSFYRILCEFSGYESEFFKAVDNEEDIFAAIDSGRRYAELSENPVEKILEWVRECPDLTIESISMQAVGQVSAIA